jgi:carbon-monoxide dehydrogenase medium subunit
MDIAVVGAGRPDAWPRRPCTRARWRSARWRRACWSCRKRGGARRLEIDEAALGRLAAAASAAAKPIDDKRGTKEFRTDVAGVLAKRAALKAAERAGQK